MMKKYFYFLFGLALSVMTASPSYAQRHDGYCDGTQTTADVLECVNRHKSDVQERMNNIFDKAKDVQDQESFARLGTAQRAWLAYRDAQCAWEAGLAANPSLKKIYELSCLTLLTNLRTDLLATTLETESRSRPREFGTTPRWINVLIDDYPSVYWRFGRWIHADLDCDGMEEEAISGISFTGGTGHKGKAVRQNTSFHVVVAVAENPMTGKPAASTVNIPVKTEQEKPEAGAYLCSPSAALSLTDHPHNIDAANEGSDAGISEEPKAIEKNSCRALQIQDHQCKPVLLYWNGQEYVLESRQAADSEGL